MTSTLVPVGVSYAGTDCQRANLTLFLYVFRGLNEPPSVRGDDTIVPGLAGRIAGSRENDVLDIQLRGWIAADPTLTTKVAIETDFATTRATFRALFSPSRARANLVLTLPGGATKTISALPLPGLLYDEKIPEEYAEVSVPLEGYGDWT
jgi:hypothetical protein